MKASALVLILILTAAFIIMISWIADFVTLEIRTQARSIASQRAFAVAEAGLEYYRWRLAHFPADFQDGTGGVGPYVHSYQDPQGGVIGQFSLEITPSIFCGETQWVDITSTGDTTEFPNMKKTLRSRFTRPSVASYATIVNTNVLVGSGRTIKGRYHSNGGIRMEGTNDSLVTSAVSTWNCTPSFGCGSPFEVKPGVFGSGPGGAQGLWQFPVEPIDFTLISQDLANIKSIAQARGVYIPRPQESGYPTAKGYRVIFNVDGTVTVNVVRNTTWVWACAIQDSGNCAWYKSYEVISQEALYNTYTLPADCPAVFVEGDTWMEGTVAGKKTVVSANLIDGNIDTSVILNGNIAYANTSSGLTVIGEKNVRIALYSPDQLTLNGIFIAQKGYFGRDYYQIGHTPWHIRTKMTLKGSIISNKRIVILWGGANMSGYINRDESYDAALATAPPPLTPFTDDEYEFVKWEEL